MEVGIESGTAGQHREQFLQLRGLLPAEWGQQLRFVLFGDAAEFGQPFLSLAREPQLVVSSVHAAAHPLDEPASLEGVDE